MTFEKSLSIANDMQLEVNKETRAAALNILRILLIGTPVDTGRARGNWFVGVNSSVRSIEDNRRSSTASVEGKTVIGTASRFNYPTIVVSNNLPYIEKLNNGHSKQAPIKYVELAIQKVQNV